MHKTDDKIVTQFDMTAEHKLLVAE